MYRYIAIAVVSLLPAACGQLSPDSAERLARGKAAQANGDYSAAAVDFKALLQQDPDQTEVRVLLGEVLLQAGDMAGAEKEFRRALSLLAAGAEEGAEEGTLNASSDFTRRARIGLALSQMNLRDFSGAQETVAPLIEQAPEDLTLHQIAAQAAFLGGRDEEARRHLEVVLAGLPDHPGANFMLGVVHMRGGRSAEAERFLDRALSLQPDNNAARFILAQLKTVLGKPLEALDALIPLLQQTVTDVRILQLLESVDMSDEMVAFEVLTRAERLGRESPNSPVPPLLRATALLATEQFGDAADAFREAAARGGGRYAMIGSVVAYGRDQNRDAARQVISEWLESNPDDSTLRMMLASDYIGSGDLESAATEYEHLLGEQGSNATVLNNLAWLYGELGDERAIGIAREAYRLAPQEAEIIDTLGWLLVQNGESEEGIEFLREAVRRAPGVDAIRSHLVQALAEIGAEEEANRVLAGMAGPAVTEVPEGRAAPR